MTGARHPLRPGHPIGRRAFLAAAGALLVGACSGDHDPGTARGADTGSAAPSAPSRPGEPAAGDGVDAGVVDVTVHPPRSAVLPAVRTWQPTTNEVEPAAKRTAARVIEALGTDMTGTDPAQRLREAGADAALAGHAGALIPPGSPAVVELVYPQYGGLTADRASVMAVARQIWADGAGSHRRTVTADVRMRRSGAGTWSVTELRVPDRLGTGGRTLRGAARELADRPGVDLPDAARADLARDVVDAVVVHTLNELARDFGFSVSVFRAGHPDEVFGTDRISNHTRGRAVDIWAIDGRPVVEMARDDSLLLSFLAAARERGSDEIGAPIDPDGAGGVHFTDDLHRDHVHIGFEP
ncbi:hypothetical protein [Phytoactinopolyspora halotolerans]|uniref:Uncharacterized protein n=1 Tax=Phytoactinopolyspora halotolerans TaxID=1981512 RepID=A0A6L9SE26_9ACTN|nr:hypothetical protein [Phytoactinopolyspora halotolerans]NEE02874.1 hypothetical protein [Phytoactinopolyspora halotolerans]